MARAKQPDGQAKAKSSAAPKGGMDTAHKEALAAGRAASRAVGAYLALLDQRPKRGRKRTAESVGRQLARVQERLAKGEPDPVTRLSLVQERMDLTAELEAMRTSVDVASIEAGFIAHAKGFSERKQVSYSAWRELGVPAEMLRRAGITRARTS